MTLKEHRDFKAASRSEELEQGIGAFLLGKP